MDLVEYLRVCLVELYAAPDPKKPTPLQNFSAKNNQLQQLHCGSAPKKGGAAPNSMVFVEYLRGAPPTPSFLELG
jgi:hypothetical protein